MLYCNKMEKIEQDVIFVFDENSKQSACCIITDEEKLMYPNQIFTSSQCTFVHHDFSECKRIMKKTKED